MPNSIDENEEREQQLDAVIAAYYRAIEAGECVDQKDFIAQHPGVERDLREFFADLRMFQDSNNRDSGDPALEPTITTGTAQRKSFAAGTDIRYFGAYEILEELGVGGMGVVYKARHARLRKIVALKMIRTGELASESDVNRFKAEARATAGLDHPGIVAVHEVGMHDSQYFYSMDFVAGGSLSKLHRDEPVPARRAAEVVRQMAEAINYSHVKGIVHRDLKPANVLLTINGVPRITDFGLAKRMWAVEDSVAVTMTETGQILGTAGYMSPEQAEGKAKLVGPPADIYALGAVLYALLTSRAPFVGESHADTIMQVIRREPISPRTLNPSVPRDLETICLKCLSKEPHGRYGTAQLLAEDLQRFLEGRPVLARPISRPARAWRWCRRNPWVSGLATAVLASLVIGSIVSTSLGMVAHRNSIESEKRGAALTVSLEDSQKKLAEIVKLTKERAEALDESRWQVYRFRLMRLEQLWQEKNWGHLERLLDVSVPTPGEKDLRGWEWHYLKAQLDRRVWRMYEKPDTEAVAEETAIDWDQHTDKLAVCRKGVIDIWLAGERRLLKSISAPVESRAGALRWSPNHRQLAVLGTHPGDFDIHIIDTETETTFCTLVDPDPPSDSFVNNVEWSPNGAYVAVTFAGRAIRIWKVADEPIPLKLLESPDGVVSHYIHWSPDQATCVTTSLDGWVMHWNTADWTLRGEKKRHFTEWCHDVAWSPDGTRMALASRIAVVVGADGMQSKPLADQGATVIAVRWLDNKRLITANNAHELRIVHVDEEMADEVFRLHSQQLKGLSLGPNEQIASVAPGESVKVWSSEDIKAHHITLPGTQLPRNAVACRWNPRLNILALVAQQQGSDVAATWSPGASQMHYVPLTAGTNSLTWTPCGDALSIETTGGLWTSIPWPLTPSVPPKVTTEPMGTSFSSDGRFRVEARLHTGQLEIVDQQHQAASAFPKIGTPYAYAWHPTEYGLAVAQHGRVQLCHPLLDPSSWRETPFDQRIQVTRTLSWNPDGTHLLAGGTSGVILVLNGTSLEIEHALFGHAGSVTAAAWSPDSTRIVSAGLCGFLRWWDPKRGVELFKIPISKSDSIVELSFSADGHWLAGRTEAGMVYVWMNASPSAAGEPLSSGTEPEVFRLKPELPTYLESPIGPLAVAIERHPRDKEAYLRRGRWFVARQQWREARADFERAHDLDPEDPYTQSDLTTLCLMLEDYAAYNKHCALIKKQLGSDIAGFESLRTVALGPANSGDTLQELQSKVDEWVANAPDDWFAIHCKMLTLYRVGKWKDCEIAVRRKLPNGPSILMLVPWLYRAMALKQLGRIDEAKGALDNASRFVEMTNFSSYSEGLTNTTQRDVTLTWFAFDLMRAKIVYREAAQLILDKSDELKIAHLALHDAPEEIEWSPAPVKVPDEH